VPHLGDEKATARKNGHQMFFRKSRKLVISRISGICFRDPETDNPMSWKTLRVLHALLQKECAGGAKKKRTVWGRGHADYEIRKASVDPPSNYRKAHAGELRCSALIASGFQDTKKKKKKKSALDRDRKISSVIA